MGRNPRSALSKPQLRMQKHHRLLKMLTANMMMLPRNLLKLRVILRGLRNALTLVRTMSYLWEMPKNQLLPERLNTKRPFLAYRRNSRQLMPVQSLLKGPCRSFRRILTALKMNWHLRRRDTKALQQKSMRHSMKSLDIKLEYYYIYYYYYRLTTFLYLHLKQ